MTAELLFYLLLVTIGLLLCLKPIRNEFNYNLITLFLFTIYSAITRFSGFDIDIHTYAKSLIINSMDIYYLREPVYWLTSRYVYKVLQSPELTFMLYDFISFIFILKVRSNLNFPQYFPYLFLLFFPMVMGINNVYRQYLSYCFIMFFISLQFTASSPLKKWIFLLISILTHNASALFAPLAFIINNKNRLSYKAILSALGVVLLLPYTLDSKSNTESGEVAAGLYLFILIVVFLIYIASYRFKVNAFIKKFFYMYIYMISLLSMSIVLMGSSQSKRIGMYCLIISLIPLTIAIESNFKHKSLVRIIIFITLISPTLLFSSSLDMLLTSSL